MKTAFVTGANRGFGLGFVEYLLSQGYQVFAGTRSLDKILPQRENLFWIQCDVTDNDSIDKAFEEVSAKTKRLTLLINNAGVNKDTIPEGSKDLVSKLDGLDRKALLNMFNLNSVSPMIIVQKFLPLLTDTPSFIINVSSAAGAFDQGRQGSTANYGYRGTKAALNMMTACSLRDLPQNIKTFAIHPGGIKTDMNPDGVGDALERAKSTIAFVDNWKDEYNGRMLSYDGTIHPF